MSGVTGFGVQDEDEKFELSGHALAALQEFYSDTADKETRFGNLKAAVEQQGPKGQLSMDMFSEDWNASQFWYSDDTATFLADQLLRGATEKTRIAVVSAPSAFVQLKNILASWTSEPPHLCLLEFDERFNVFQEFVHYDFEHPFRLPGEMKGKYDRILCDPPFLSPDCQTKAAMTVRWLSKPQPTGREDLSRRLLVCTGERMENLIHRLYPDIHTTSFEPHHAQDRLSNDFRCYANYQCAQWSWS